MLIVPVDLLGNGARANSRPRCASLGRFPVDRMMADQESVREAAGLLAGAKAPMMIAGGGVHLSDASAELAALQHQAYLPVATTAIGKGSVDERHPLSLGVVGCFLGTRGRTRHLRDLVEQADVVLLIGNRTDQNWINSWTLSSR